MKCIKCENEITAEMLQSSMCFHCGTEIPTTIEAYKKFEEQAQIHKEEERKQLAQQI